MMATMDRPSRIVRCPKCLALLQEPPPGTPLYKCGNCSTVLRAKHASADGSRRPSARLQQQNSAAQLGHAGSIDDRLLPSKSLQPEHTSRQPNLGGPADQISRAGNSRPTAADTGMKLPSLGHHSSYPPGPTPLLPVPNTSNTDDDNGLRPGRDHRRPALRDSLAAHSSADEGFRPGREGLTLMPPYKISSPAHVEEAHAGKKLANHGVHNILSPPADRSWNSAAKFDTMGEKDELAGLRTRNTPVVASAINRQKSPSVDPAVEAPRYRRPTTEVLREESTKRESDHQLNLEDKDEKLDDEDDQEPTDRKAFTSRSDAQLEVIGSFGPIKRDAAPHFSPHRSPESIPGVNRNRRPPAELSSEGSTKRASDLQSGLEDKDEESDGEDVQEPSNGKLSTSRPGAQLEVFGSFGASKSDASPCFSPRRSPESIPGVNRNRRPPVDVLSEGSTKKESDRQLGPEGKAEKLDDEDEQEPTDWKSSTSRPGDQREVIGLLGPNKAGASPHRSPESIPGANRYRRPPAEVSSEGSTKRESDRQLGPEGKAEKSDGEDEQEPTDWKSSTSRSGDQGEVIGSFGPIKSDSSPHFSPHRSPESIAGANRYRRPPAEVPRERSTGIERALQVKPEDIDDKSDDENEHDPTDWKSSTSRSGDQLEVINSFDPTQSGAYPHFSTHHSPESIQGLSPSQAQGSEQRKQELQETFTGQSPSLESNSFSFGQGKDEQVSAYPLVKGQTQKVRLQINTPVPERIHVRCRHCSLQLEAPLNLPRSETGVQKLRCGSCWKISRFRLNHLLSPFRSPSPDGSDNSPESSFRLGSNSSDGASGRYSGTRSNRETDPNDTVVLRTQSGANLPVPPSARHNPRGASGLANMVSGPSLLSETSKASTPNTSGDLGPAGSSAHGGRENVDTSPSGHAEPLHASLSPAFSSKSQDISSKDRQQKTSPDLKILQSSSDSDEEKATTQLKIGPAGFNPVRMTAWPAPETPDFDDGPEFKGLKGFFKKSVKELTKGKKSSQYRRKVVVNGHAVPDDVVKRAEEFAGAIHPGTYWYDCRAGFWGVMGGPCLGMIPPFIEELNFPLARHCSHGKTGVLVNGRELHHKDLELLKKRGLPGTPGKAYNVDIDGRLTEDTTGIELKGLGRLAPTLEQTGRGPGMWVPESQRGS